MTAVVMQQSDTFLQNSSTCFSSLLRKLGQTNAQFSHLFMHVNTDTGELCLLHPFAYLWANLSWERREQVLAFLLYFLSLSPNCPYNPAQADIMPLLRCLQADGMIQEVPLNPSSDL